MFKCRILLLSILCIWNVHASQTTNSPLEEGCPTLANHLPSIGASPIINSLGEDPYSWLEDSSWSVDSPLIKDQNIAGVLNSESDIASQFFGSFKKYIKKVNQLLKKIDLPGDKESKKVGDQYYSHQECKKTGATKIYVSSKSRPKVNEKRLVLNLSELNPFSDEAPVDEDYRVSPDGHYLIYSFDAYGWLRHSLGIYDLTQNKHLEEKLIRVDGDVVWHKGPTQGFYYTTLNQKTLFWHTYNHPQQNDTFMYHDPEKCLDIITSSDGKDVFLCVTDYKDEDEIFMVTSQQELVKLLDRKELMKSEGTDSIGTAIFLALNDQNSRGLLRKVIVENNIVIESKNVMEPTAELLFKDLKANARGLIALTSTPEGDSVWMFDREGQNLRKLSFDPLLQKQICFDSYQDFHDESISLHYNSLSTRESVGYVSLTKLTFQPDMRSPKGFDPKDYKQQVLYVESEDGVKVPVTVAYNPSKLSSSNDNVLILSAYGAYGEKEELCLDETNVVLMNGGVILAHAHVRGGGEYGPQWHEGGKLLNKKKSFSDYLSVADFLVKEKWVKNENLVAQGVSAGGIIMGYIANNGPTKFGAILMEVPFLHVYRDSHKPALMVTGLEKCEWGDVSNADHAEYIKSYCPYENMRKQVYPAMLIQYGLVDDLVPYWNTLKYVKKIKDHHTGQSPIIAAAVNSSHGLDSFVDVRKIVFLKAIFSKKIKL